MLLLDDELETADLTEKEDAAYDDLSNSAIQHADEWLDEQGKPDYPDLAALADEGTPVAMEELRELAEKYNIEYGVETTPQELIQKIMWAIDESGDNESI